jgi:polyhydroxyalkanoate synthesis regulator phasin
MKKPTVEEIKEYMVEKGEFNADQAEAFFDYHESKGWKVGKVAMKDWKAAVRTWIRNSRAWGSRYATSKRNNQTHADRQIEQARAALEALERGN